MTEQTEQGIPTTLIGQEGVTIQVNQPSFVVTTFGEISPGFFFLTPSFELAVKMSDTYYLLPGVANSQGSLSETVRVYVAEVDVTSRPTIA